MDSIKKPYSVIDTAKAICILAVVLGHAGVFSRFFYFFHLPVFFFLNGLLIHTNYSVKDFVVKRIKSLYVPYIITMFICALLFDRANMMHIKYIVKILLFDGSVYGLGAMWFIPCLFINTIIAFLIRKFLNKTTIKIIIVCFFIVTAIIVGKYKPVWYYYLHLIPYIQLIYCIASFADLKILESFFQDKKRCMGICLLSFFILIILYAFSNIQIDLVNLKLIHPVLWLLLLIVDICFVLSLSSLLPDIVPLKVIGGASFYIMALHFLCFSVINLLVATIKNAQFDAEYFYTYSILFPQFKVGYILAGILIPCAIKNLINRIMKNE